MISTSIAVALGAPAAACGDASYDAPVGGVVGDAGRDGDGGGVILPPRDAAPRDTAAPGDAADGAIPPERGTLAGAQETTVADTTCAARGGSAVVLDGAAGSSGPVVATSRVAGRRAVELSAAAGALLVDADGSNAGAFPLASGAVANVTAAEGAAIGVAAGSGVDVVYRRFDAAGTPVGAGLTLSTGRLPLGIAAAGGGGHALVAWAEGTSVRARGVEDGALGPATFDVATGTPTTFFAATVAYDGAGGFGLAWSAAGSGGTYELAFAHVSAAGADRPGLELLAGPSQFGVAKLVRIPTGYALLYNASGAVFLAFLGDDGKPTSAVRRLAGATVGWDVAVGAGGAELGVVARRASGEAEFRPFSTADGHAIGGWVCLDAPSVGDPDQRAAIDADPGAAGDAGAGGYAVVYRTPARVEGLARFDHLGTGP